MRNQAHENEQDAIRRSTALIGLIIVLGLAIAAISLIRELDRRSRIEDCLLAGRTHCTPIEVPSVLR